MADKPDDMLAKLPKRLKEARQLRGLSLQGLSQACGVSRSMLSQIERGESSPTIATLWHLTRALKVDFASLLDAPPPPVQIDVMRAADVPLIENLGTGCRMRVLSATDTAHDYGIYEVMLDEGGVLHRQANVEGAQEHLTVISGVVDVSSGEGVERLTAGDTARYAADVQHRIATVEGPVRVFLVVQEATLP